MKAIQSNLISLMFIGSVTFTSALYAQSNLSAGQAVTLCKDEMAKQYAEYSRSKTSNIKQRRGIFNIKLRVYLTERSIIADCRVNQDGTISIEES